MTEPVLETRNLQKSYGALVVTNDVSISLLPGEIHALIGPNGAGKSTLVAQIAGSLIPDSGSVYLSGKNLHGLTVAQRAKLGLGRSFQVSSLAMPLSVFQNISIAAMGATGKRLSLWRQHRSDQELIHEVHEILGRIGLSERAETPVSALSHGERRLVELGCALAGKPKALLLDEPMAGLDQQGSTVLTEFLRGLKKTVPILLIEHDMDAVFSLSDHLTVLVDGKVIANGPPEIIRANKEVEAAYLGEMPC